jgi:outer membrane lipoprotein-sorting protein
MKNPLLKIAAVAATVVIMMLVLTLTPNNVTFAQVAESLLNAHTVVFDFTVGDEVKGFTARDIVIGSKLRRNVPSLNNILIMDLDASRMLVLDTVGKSAVYVNIEGALAEGQRNVINLVRNAVTFAMNDPGAVIEELGRKTVDGREAVGFHISDPSIEADIWADSDSALPVRIQMALGNSPYVLKNIEFDVPLDESLVSMEVPQGYTLIEQQGDWSEFSENDFIVVLRIFAEFLNSGNYPETLRLEDVMGTQPPMARMPKPTDMSDEEAMDIIMSYGKGIVFFGHLAESGADWRYTGRGVKFGEADKVVFWYRMPDSSSYRAVYGDLHVEDVPSPDLLP